MNDTNTGGPAFPSTEPSQEHTPFFNHHDGMTLRDYFAAKAITAFIFAGCDYDRAATEAYAQADAMLKAREA